MKDTARTKLIEALFQFSNCDNFNVCGISTGIGFTRKYNGVNYYVDVRTFTDQPWKILKVQVTKYGDGLFNYTAFASVVRRRDVWKAQKALLKVGVYMPMKTLREFLKEAS